MQTCGNCGYERREMDSILDARSCPRCGIVYDKWRAADARHARRQASVDHRKPADEKIAGRRPFVKYLAALSLLMFGAIIVVSVVVLYKSQNPYSVMSRQAVGLAIAGIVFAVLALTGVGRYGATGIVAPAILGIVFNAGWIAIANPVLSKITTDEYKLERAVQAMDKRCPMIWNDVRINAVYYEPGNKITLSATMLKIAWKDLPGYGREHLLETLKSYMVGHIKQNEKLYRFYHKIDWTCVIKTNDDIEYLRIRIRPSDFG